MNKKDADNDNTKIQQLSSKFKIYEGKLKRR